MQKRFKIIVVDDNKDMRELYADVFQTNGFEVFTAEDGLAGLEKIDQEAPDVVFTGIMMPRMDGFTLVETLKKNVKTASIPVVFLSHLGREEDKVRAEALGVKQFLIQGMVSANDVVRTVRALLLSNDYFIFIDPQSPDAQKLAQDLGLNPDFICNENGGQKLALKLSVKDAHRKMLDAEFVCI